MSIFPGGIASFLGFTSSHTLSADQHAAQHNSEQAEITATQTKIGTGSSTPTSGTLLRGTGVGTSSWAQAVLTSDVSGVLPQANGGTGTTLATGTGKAVYDTSPTISSPTVSGGTFSSPTLTTPTIASFVNAIHNHENNAGGGTLNAANALQANSISANNISSSAITLGVAQSTTNFSTANQVPTQITGLTVTVTIPSGTRYIEITVFCGAITNTSSSIGIVTIWDGTVGSGTQLAQANSGGVLSLNQGVVCTAIVTPATGNKTYNASFQVTGNTGTFGAAVTQPAFIVVKAN